MADTLLVQQFRDREEHAVSTIFEKWYRESLKLAHYITGDELLLYDIFSDAFQKVLHHLPPSVVELEDLEAYLKMAVRNMARDYKRRQLVARKYHRHLTHTAALQEELLLAGEHPDFAASDILFQAVCAYIDTFPAQRRLIVEYRFYKKWGPAHIAQQLNLSLSTVHNQIAIGRKALKKKFPAAAWLPEQLPTNYKGFKK